MKSFPRSGLAIATLLLVPSLFARDDTLTVSVRGQVAPDYKRVNLADGSFKPERYVVSNGGKFPGTTTDASMDKVTYPEVAGVVARHLAKQQYYLAQRAKDADLLIAIYWGETIPSTSSQSDDAINGIGQVLNEIKLDTLQQAVDPNNSGVTLNGSNFDQKTGEISPGGGGVAGGAQGDRLTRMEFGMARAEMGNQMRDQANADNARILGYLDDINDRREMTSWADVGDLQHDLISDVEESRYYIVVRAYDFKALQQEGKQVVRWVTRISIGSQGHAFDERVAQMVAAGAKAFGQKQGLRRHFYGDPRVDLGETKYLGETSLPAAGSTK